MILQNGIDQRRVAGPVFEDLIPGDELLLDLLQQDHVPELDRLCDLATDQQLGMRLEQAEQLLRVRYLLAREDPAGGLVDDPLDQFVIALQLAQQSGQNRAHLQIVELGCQPLADGGSHLSRPVQHARNMRQQGSIRPFEFAPVVLFVGGAPCDPQHQAFDPAVLETTRTDRLGVVRADPSDQSRGDTIAIPQQTGVGRVMDVGLARRGVDTQAGAGDAFVIDGVATEQPVHLLPRLGRDRLVGFAQQAVVHHLAVVDADEAAQELAVVDPHHGLAIGQPLDFHDQNGAQQMIAGEVGGALASRFAQDPGNVPMEHREDLGSLGENPVDRLILLMVVSRHFQARGTEVQRLLGVQFDSHACSLPWVNCLGNQFAQ